MTDWIMQSACKENIHNLSTTSAQPENPWKFTLLEDAEALSVDNPVDKMCVNEWISAQVGQMPERSFAGWNNMDKTEPIPLKTSVSAIAKKKVLADPMPLTDAEEDMENKRASEEIVSPLRLSELPARPAFLEAKKITGAERGTLVHRALSLLPLEKLCHGDIDRAVHESLHEMVANGIFTPQELLRMDMRGAAAFFRSDLGQRLLSSRKVRREWSFNLVMDDVQGTLLQGVIDCAFMENEGWVLVDYKTDRIEDEEAFCQRYAMQIEWYARALERITGSPVHEAWLYAIGKRKAYRMNRIES